SLPRSAESESQLMVAPPMMPPGIPGMPSPGMGPPPGMPPPGMDPTAQPFAMGAPPPEPPVLEPDQLTMVLGSVEEAIARDGVEKVRDLLSALPPEILDELYRLIDTDVRAAI